MILFLIACLPQLGNTKADDSATESTPPEDCTWYADADGDGFGNGAYALEADCGTPPQGYVAQDGDCDDERADVYPDAPEDDCEDPVDYDCDGVGGAQDGDGDGEAGCTDCDDTNASVYTGADELCDGLDNDCDGATDGPDSLDAQTFWEDGDADGYGDPEQSVVDCEPGDSQVANDGDCDDNNSALNPGVDEICDGVDNDCSGLADDAAVDAPTWYYDADGDGYGVSDTTASECEAPSGFVDSDTDCDELDPEIHPGADEVCDGVDNDCDGSVDPDTSLDAESWYTDTDGDGYGDPSSAVSSCEQPSGTLADGSDCDDADDTVFPGSHETETPGDGIDADCDGYDGCTDLNCDAWPDIVMPMYTDGNKYDVKTRIFYSASGTFSKDKDLELPTYGAQVAAAEDLNGDGYLDLVFTSQLSGDIDDDPNYEVDSLIYWGSVTGYSADDSTGLETVGASDLCLGDFDGDGTTDLGFAGIRDHEETWEATSSAFLGASYTSAFTTSTQATRSCAVADFDGDGTDDLALGSMWASDGDVRPIEVYFGSSTGLSTGSVESVATDYGAYTLIAEDIDGDGDPDLVAAARYDEDGVGSVGTSYVLENDGTGSLTSSELVTAGSVDAAVGDLNQDGYPDIVFANFWDGSETTVIDSTIYWGSSAGFTTSSALETTGGVRVEIADLDGDSWDDLVFCNYYDYGADDYTIESIIYWNSSGSFGGTSTAMDTHGCQGIAVGDLDLDGDPELIFGAFRDDNDYSAKGRIYFGPTFGTKQDLDVKGMVGDPLIVGPQ